MHCIAWLVASSSYHSSFYFPSHLEHSSGSAGKHPHIFISCRHAFIPVDCSYLIPPPSRISLPSLVVFPSRTSHHRHIPYKPISFVRIASLFFKSIGQDTVKLFCHYILERFRRHPVAIVKAIRSLFPLGLHYNYKTQTIITSL